MPFTAEEKEREYLLHTRKEKAKNDIILRALSEFSDLEALRKEKRAIVEEGAPENNNLNLHNSTVQNSGYEPYWHWRKRHKIKKPID